MDLARFLSPPLHEFERQGRLYADYRPWKAENLDLALSLIVDRELSMHARSDHDWYDCRESETSAEVA